MAEAHKAAATDAVSEMDSISLPLPSNITVVCHTKFPVTYLLHMLTCLLPPLVGSGVPGIFQVCLNSGKVRLNSGILERRHSQWDKALHHFRKAREIDDTYCEPDYWIGATLLQQGKHIQLALAVRLVSLDYRTSSVVLLNVSKAWTSIFVMTHAKL